MIILIISLVILAGVVTYALCSVAAPANEAERKADDDAQVEYLNKIRKGL